MMNKVRILLLMVTYEKMRKLRRRRVKPTLPENKRKKVKITRKMAWKMTRRKNRK